MYSRAVWHAQTYTRKVNCSSKYLRRWRALHTSSCLFRPATPSSTPSDDAHRDNNSDTVDKSTKDHERQIGNPANISGEGSTDAQTDQNTVTGLNEQLRAARISALGLVQQIQDGGRRRTSMRAKRPTAAEVPPVELPEWFIRTNIARYSDLRNAFPKLMAKYDRRSVQTYAEIRKEELNSVLSDDGSPADGAGASLVESAVWREMFLTLRGSFAMIENKATPSFATAKAHISLFSPVDGTLDWLKRTVTSLAVQTHSDVIALDAFTLSRLGEVILPRPSDVADHPIRSLSFETHKEEAEEEIEEDEEEDEEEQDEMPRKGIMVVKRLKGGLEGLPQELSQMFGKSIKLTGGGLDPASIMIPGMGAQDAREIARNSPEGQAISGMFEAMIDAWLTSRNSVEHGTSALANTRGEGSSSEVAENKSILSTLVDSIKEPFREHTQTAVEVDAQEALPNALFSDQPRLIIQIADAAFLTQTNIGLKLMDSLLDVVQRRRAAGQHITIIGISASSRFAAEADAEAAQKRIHLRNAETLYRPFFLAPRMKSTPPLAAHEASIESQSSAETAVEHVSASPSNGKQFSSSPMSGTSKEFERASVNLRHVIDFCLRMAKPNVHLSPELETVLNSGGRELFLRILQSENNSVTDPVQTLDHSVFGSRIMEQSEVHAIALTLTGMQTLQAPREPAFVSFSDIVTAFNINNHAKLVRERFQIDSIKSPTSMSKDPPQTKPTPPAPDPFDGIRKSGNKYEQRLLTSAVASRNIKTTFDQVHVQPSTIETLKTLTSLSLQRPDAFRYGVLAADTIPGLLLYGPPGTGKTLLAKAVAKQANVSMLSISGADVNHMYVGESEKSVKAIFSVARKMAPCVVFIDEADSIFGSRSQVRQKPSHRDTINQFLREWDGLDERSVFLMVATNRPFDLDDAVLRRLARRVLVDLPTKDDREAILRIHLRDEQLDSNVSLATLAEKTPFYSGSDLKNVAVAAALSCVREELAAEETLKKAQAELAAKAQVEREADTDAGEPPSTSPSESTETPTQAYVRPARRILLERHFTKALEEISASVGEDMASLKAMKKFDEQYGDRKGRRKKQTYGFLDVVAEEKNARVRV